MGLILADDYILLQKEERVSPSGLVFHPSSLDPRNVIEATVLATGPGEQRPGGGRYELPCRAGDRVVVMAGAGVKWTDDEKVEHWVVFGMRKDVIAVVGGALQKTFVQANDAMARDGATKMLFGKSA